MATVTDFVDNEQTTTLLPGVKHTVIKFISFSDTNVSADDVVQLIKIPQGAFVSDVKIYIDTAEGADCTATVGDEADPNGWDASVNLNATAGTVTSATEGTDAYGVGEFYAVADTIDLVMGHDTDTAEIVICVEYALADGKTIGLLA